MIKQHKIIKRVLKQLNNLNIFEIMYLIKEFNVNCFNNLTSIIFLNESGDKMLEPILNAKHECKIMFKWGGFVCYTIPNSLNISEIPHDFQHRDSERGQDLISCDLTKLDILQWQRPFSTCLVVAFNDIRLNNLDQSSVTLSNPSHKKRHFCILISY